MGDLPAIQDPSAAVAVPSAPANASAPNVEDACFRCGYALHGIADDQPCPECGLLAARSRQVTDELHHTRPRWLRRLSIGVWLMLLAVVAAAVAPAVMAFVQERW